MSRIFKRGNIWYMDFEYQGKRYRKSLQTRSKQIAELALKDTDVKIARERFDLEPPKDILFSDFSIKFLQWYQVQNSKRSFEDYHNLFKASLIPFFRSYPLKRINPELIEKYKQQRIEKISPSTVNKELIALRHLFNKAILWGYLHDNPAQEVDKLRVKQKSIRFLTVDEIGKLLSTSPEYIRPVLLTAIHAGLRKSELFRLEWDDIGFDRGYISVRNKKGAHTKNYKNREIPMTAELTQTLSTLKLSNGIIHSRIFLKRDGTPHGGEIRKTILKCIKLAGIKLFTLHDLRHTFASHLVMDGVDLPTVKELMGHANISTTMIYAHLAPEHLNSAIQRLGSRFRNGDKKQED
jgi:integrase